MMLANGTTIRRTYDIKERLSGIMAVKSTGEVVSSYSYAYNKADLRKEMKINHEGVLVAYGADGLSRLTSEVWNVGAGLPACGNQFTSQPAGNESGFSNVAKATPRGGVLTDHYIAYYEYDAAGNRTIKRTMVGSTTSVCDDENRLTDEYPTINVPLNAVVQTTQENWHEVDFGFMATVSRIDLQLPGTSNRFKVQGFNGVAYEDLTAVVEAGSTLGGDGWHTPMVARATLLFAGVQASKIRYWNDITSKQIPSSACN